jgi:hypothetical protein
MVDDIEKWPYSNYLEWIERRSDRLVDREFISWYFKNEKEYRAFIMDYKSIKHRDKDFDRYLFD